MSATPTPLRPVSPAAPPRSAGRGAAAVPPVRALAGTGAGTALGLRTGTRTLHRVLLGLALLAGLAAPGRAPASELSPDPPTEAASPAPIDWWSQGEAAEALPPPPPGERGLRGGEDRLRVAARLRDRRLPGDWRSQLRLSQSPRRGPGWLAPLREQAPVRLGLDLQGQTRLDAAGTRHLGLRLGRELWREGPGLQPRGRMAQQELWLGQTGRWLSVELALGRDRCRGPAGSACLGARWSALSLGSAAAGPGAWQLVHSTDRLDDGGPALRRWALSLDLGALGGGVQQLDGVWAAGRPPTLQWHWQRPLD